MAGAWSPMGARPPWIPQQPLLTPALVPGGAAACAPARSASSATYVAYSEGSDAGESVIQTLTGDFAEIGINHGRPTYQKQASTMGDSALEVFIYYWDHRDGSSFEGWWFGKAVGGNEVWSHNTSRALKPPERGWKIPFAGPVRQTFVLKPKGASAAAPASVTSAANAMAHKHLTDEAQAAHTEASAAVQQARSILATATAAVELDAVEQAMAPFATSLTPLQKRVDGAVATATGPLAYELRAASHQLKTTLASVTQELQKIRVARPRLVHAQKIKEADAKDQATLAEMLAEATEKANAVEDMVEKTVITYGMVDHAGDDAQELARAVDQTHKNAVESQRLLKEALALIGRKMVSAKTFMNDATRERAAAELNGFRGKLRDANMKLNPMLNVKQEFQQRGLAKLVVQEVLDKLSPAELDIDRAVEAAEPLVKGAWPSKEVIKQAEQAITIASDKFTTAFQMLEIKMKPAVGVVKKELERLETRAKTAEKRLLEIKNAHRRYHERESSTTFVTEVGEKMKGVQEAVRQLEEAFGPYLMGVEMMSPEENQEAIRAGDEAMKAANKATAAARITISMKLVEVKRYTEESGQEAQRQLQEFQKQLELGMKRVGDLRAACHERKNTALREELLSRLETAEDLARQVVEKGGLVADESKLHELTIAEIREAAAATRKCQAEATEVMRAAQSTLTTRQIEAKNSGDAEESAELARLQVRFRNAQADVGKYRTLPAAVEQHIEKQKHIDEATGRVAAAEAKVNEAVAFIQSLGKANGIDGDEEESEVHQNPLDRASAASKSTTSSLNGVARYLDVQAKSQKMPADDLARLQERVKVSQERLEGALQTMRENADKGSSRALVEETGAAVKAAEAALGRMLEASAPFMADADADAGEDAARSGNDTQGLVAVLKTTEQEASKALGTAKTVIAVKRIAARRFAESVAKWSLEQLSALQGRVDAASQSLSEAKKETAERKYAKAKGEAAARFASAERRLASMVAAMEAVEAAAGGEQVDASEMQTLADKATQTQQDAQAAISEARTLLQAFLRDMRTGESANQTEFSQLLVKVGPLQAELDKRKRAVAEREHKQAAGRLLQEAGALIADLDVKVQRATAAAAPLISEERTALFGSIYLARAVDAMREHVRREPGRTLEQLFATIKGDHAGIGEADFVGFLQSLPELEEEGEEAPLADSQLKAAYWQLDSVGGGQVSERQFTDQFQCRYICVKTVGMTSDAQVAGSKTVRKLEVNETVRGVGEPVNDDAAGLLRLRCRAEKDAAEGYVTLRGKEGTLYLEVYTPYAVCVNEAERQMQDLHDAVSQWWEFAKHKSKELKDVRSNGPSGEAKAELLKMRGRASKAQKAHGDLKKKIAQAQRDHEKHLEAEQRRKAEAADKVGAAAMMNEATELVESVATRVEEAASAVEGFLASSLAAGVGNALQAMEEHGRTLEQAAVAVDKATDKIMKENLNEIRNVQNGPYVEARRLMFRLKVRLSPLDDRCNIQRAALDDARSRIARYARRPVSEALQACGAEGTVDADALFAQLSKGAAQISVADLRELLEKHGKLSEKQIDLGLHSCAEGVSRLKFAGMFQDYLKCVKDIALTAVLEVKNSSNTLRKLEANELLEVIGQGATDDTLGLERVRCRALRDLVEGWVTVRGSQGTAFLEAARKPYLIAVNGPVVLQQAFEQGGDERPASAEAGEVFEVLEGPRKEPPVEVQRVKVKAHQDQKIGWLTFRVSQNGLPGLEAMRLVVCKTSTAMTDGFDIAKSSALRKLDAGEMLERLEEPKEDEERKLTRARVRAKRDGKEGWATVRGTQGTVYLADSPSIHRCVRGQPLEASQVIGGRVVLTLEKDELVEIVEGPTTEVKEGAMRARGRSLRSGAEGWFTVNAGMQPWSPHLRCARSTDLHALPDGAQIPDGVQILRTLAEGETLEALEAPTLEQLEGRGALRARVRAERDGAVGHATLRTLGAKVEVFLEPALDAA